ncbi:unnamed protein product [Owenia fusiformis]|uniref:Uncharacterized protein n=1 Tax=Owenia fusiformis TaxID=6347 RepID=A0A8S4PHC6_OWEFU|nr:unnamed protein product [Owenia fusiformis]
MDVLSVCPHLLPLNASKTYYKGFINVLERQFKIEIQLKLPGVLKDARFTCDWQLSQLLHCHRNIITQRLHHSNTLAGFLVELKTIIERQLELMHFKRAVKQSPSYYDRIVTDIEELGWDKLTSVDTEFRVLQLTAKDNAMREHTFKIELTNQYPVEAPRCTFDLPISFTPHWNQNACLKDIYNQFILQLEHFSEFWDDLDEVDKNTWILEPERPTRSAVYRRIACGNNASLSLTVDPLHPRLLPECRFLGPDHVIQEFRDSMNSNLDQWNPDTSLLENLQTLLGRKFPSPSNSKKEDFSTECGICYAYRLETQIPDQVCDDNRCKQPFHQTCLFEWLKALPSSRQSFNVVFGECPYCNKPITVKMPM